MNQKNGEAAVTTQAVPDSEKIGTQDAIKPPIKDQVRNPAALQATLVELRRDFICECLLIVSVKASHARDNVLLCDDVCAERDIGIAIDHIREAASSFRALERLIAGGKA